MPTAVSQYREQYKQFSRGVAFAVRTWHHHVHLNARAKEERAILAALDKAARYWLDQRYTAVQTTVIFLGKIFDSDGRAYGVDKTLKAAKNAKKYFSREALRKRKIESVVGDEAEWIDEYVENAAELNDDDIKAIKAQVRKARGIWEKRIKPLRDKVFAHNQMLSDAERERLYEAVEEADITNVLQILLNVSHALWQAEHNGRKPDFLSDHTGPIDWAKENMEDLIGSLLKP